MDIEGRQGWNVIEPASYHAVLASVGSRVLLRTLRETDTGPMSLRDHAASV